MHNVLGCKDNPYRATKPEFFVGKLVKITFFTSDCSKHAPKEVRASWPAYEALWVKVYGFKRLKGETCFNGVVDSEPQHVEHVTSGDIILFCQGDIEDVFVPLGDEAIISG